MEDVNNLIDTATSEAETVPVTESASPVVETTPAPTPAPEAEKPISTRDSLREVMQRSKQAAEKPLGEKTNDSPVRAIDPISGKELEPIRAPGSWTPALREKWGGIDREAQKFIADRDKHVAVTLQEAKEARDFTKKFRDISEPYTKHFPPGVDAAEVAGQLFQIDHAVRNGSPVEKAQLLFEIMQRANPDMAVLNNLMRNYAPQQVTRPAPQPQNIDAEVQRRINAEALKQQQLAQDAEAESLLAEFQNNPEYEFMHSDAFKIEMGKVLKAELVSGADDRETLKNAYEFVKRNNPDVQAILAARGSQGQATGVKPAVRPVGSVAPSLSGGTAKAAAPKADSTKDAMRLALRQRGGKV